MSHLVHTLTTTQLILGLARLLRSPFGALEYMKREWRLYDVTLFALMLWLLIKDINLRSETDDAQAAILALSAGAVTGTPIANAGLPTSSTAEFVDMSHIAESYRELKDLLSIVIVFGAVRVMRYMQVGGCMPQPSA